MNIMGESAYMTDKHCFDCKYGKGWSCTHPNREYCNNGSLWWPKKARWKGAGMGDYYCSWCNEFGDNRLRECPECHAVMYTDEEWERKQEEWKLEDEFYNTLTDEGKEWFDNMCLSDLDRGEYEG